MTIEKSHGKARPTLPRSSDLTDINAVGEPSTARGPGGLFAPGNSLGAGAGWKHAIAAALGAERDGDAGKLGKDAYRLYRAFMRDLPCDCASVRQLVSQRARAAVLSAYYANKAGELGLSSEFGMQANAEALKWDARAERLAVTSLDISIKLAGARKPIDAHATVLDTFGGKS